MGDDLALKRAERSTPSAADRLTDGASFILDAPAEPPAIWGKHGRVLWAEGESLLIVGTAGVGKTTLAQQLAFARHGIGSSELLGYPVAVDPRAVLYLAADRPRQAARSFARMVEERDRAPLETFAIHQGPLPFDITAAPNLLADYAESRDAGTVVIDSLKDVALDLSKDEAGSRVNLAFQECLARGIQLLVVHHQRKATGDNKAPRHLADVYGSNWITAGAGSVLLVWGEAGDPIVQLQHLKQPMEDIGPLELIHDHTRGATTVHEDGGLPAIVAAHPGPISAPDAARLLHHTDKPSKSQIEKTRRTLERFTDTDELRRIPAQAPDPVLYANPQRASRG